MDYWWVWSHQSANAKLRTMKFSSEGLARNFAPVKISRCTVYNKEEKWVLNVLYAPCVMSESDVPGIQT